MKKIQYILLTLFVLATINASAHYGPRGLLGGTVVCGTHNNGIVILGTQEAGVYISTNTQLNAWRFLGVGLKSGKITSVMHSGTEVYAATADSGIFAFTGSAGGNDLFWNPVNNGLSDLNILALASLDTNTLFAGTLTSGLFKSTNKGQNWQQVNSPFFNGKKVVAIVKAGTRIIAATDDSGLFASDDGNTWFSLNDSNTAVSGTKSISYNAMYDQLMLINANGFFIADSISSTTSPSYSAAVMGLPITGTMLKSLSNNGAAWFLATNDGVYSATANTAINWTQINNGLGTLDINTVIALDTVLFAGTNKMGIYKAFTSTMQWTLSNSGSHGLSNIKTYSVCGKEDSITVTATEYGIVFSENYGNSPQIRNNGLTDSLHVNDVEFAENFLLAATENSGVFWSTDYGLHWKAINSGLSHLNIRSIAYANERKYIIDANGKVYVSELNDSTWQDLSNGIASAHPVTNLAFYDDYIFASTYGGGVYKTHRNENAWTSFSNGLGNQNVTAITASAGKVFAGTDGSGIYVTDFFFDDWAPTNPIFIPHFNDVPINPNHIQHMTSFAGYVIASFRGGIVATVNNGNSWIRGGHQFHLPSYSDIRKIGFINSRIMLTTENNSMMSNSLNEFELIDTILSVSNDHIHIDTLASRVYISITSNIHWKLSKTESWFTLSVDSGYRNQNLYVDIDTNNGDERYATLTLSGGSIVRNIIVHQNGIVGIEDISASKAGILIYPNPTSGNFTVTFNENVSAISIYNINGKQLKHLVVNNQQSIEIFESLSPGLYVIKAITASGNHYQKLIIE